MGSKGDAEEILDHPFFKGIDFDKLLRKEIEPPYKPKMKSNFDLSHFDEKYVN